MPRASREVALIPGGPLGILPLHAADRKSGSLAIVLRHATRRLRRPSFDHTTALLLKAKEPPKPMLQSPIPTAPLPPRTARSCTSRTCSVRPGVRRTGRMRHELRLLANASEADHLELSTHAIFAVDNPGIHRSCWLTLRAIRCPRSSRAC